MLVIFTCARKNHVDSRREHSSFARGLPSDAREEHDHGTSPNDPRGWKKRTRAIVSSVRAQMAIDFLKKNYQHRAGDRRPRAQGPLHPDVAQSDVVRKGVERQNDTEAHQSSQQTDERKKVCRFVICLILQKKKSPFCPLPVILSFTAILSFTHYFVQVYKL